MAPKKSFVPKKSSRSEKTSPKKSSRRKKLPEATFPSQVRVRRSASVKRRYIDRRRVEREVTPPTTTLIDLIITVLYPLLRDRLSKIDWRRSFRTFFKTNLMVKGFAILASFFIFFYMKSQDIGEKNVLIPLNIVKSQNVSIANEVPENISVYVSGTKDALLNLDENQLYAELLLSSQNEEGSIAYKPLLRGFPNNVQILRASPQEIEITLSPLDRKLVEIEPEFIGAPAQDYYIVRYSVKPTRLWVTGPEEILTDLTSLKTEPISIENIKSNKEIRVLLSKSTHPLIEMDRDREFSVFIYTRSKYLSDTAEGPFPIAINLASSDLYVSAFPVVNRVSFDILEEVAETFDPYENFTFFIDPKSIGAPGVYTLPIQFEPVRGIRMRTVMPSRIRLEVLSSTEELIRRGSLPLSEDE